MGMKTKIDWCDATWKKLRFYHATIKWLWAHRKEPNNRHKRRRMMREVQE